MNLKRKNSFYPKKNRKKEVKNETYPVAIRFAKDAHLMLIDDVSDSGFFNHAPNVAYIEKNGCRVFFNMDELLYIGSAKLLGDEVPR